MQIHELTQPRKRKLDEVGIGGIPVFGDDGVIDQLKSAWKTRGKSLTAQGEIEADQDRINARAAKYAGQLQQQVAAGAEITVDQALSKLQANPMAQQWINSVVAKWSDAVKDIRAKVDDQATKRPTIAQDIQAKLGPPPTVATTPPPTATLGGKPLDPKNPNDATVLAALAKQGIKEDPATPGGATASQSAAGNDTWRTGEYNAYAAEVKNWIGTQLKTTTVDKIEKDVPEIKRPMETLLLKIAYDKDKLPEQQKTIHELFSLLVAGNHVSQARNPTQQKPGQPGQPMANPGQPVDTGLDQQQLSLLRQAAATAGGPPPKDTGNNFFNSLIAQIRGVR
jgi:hypothetical protein